MPHHSQPDPVLVSSDNRTTVERIEDAAAAVDDALFEHLGPKLPVAVALGVLEDVKARLLKRAYEEPI